MSGHEIRIGGVEKGTIVANVTQFDGSSGMADSQLSAAELREIERLRNDASIIALLVLDRNGEVIEDHSQWDDAGAYAALFDAARGLGVQLGESGASPAISLQTAHYRIMGLSLSQTDLVIVKGAPQKNSTRLQNVR